MAHCLPMSTRHPSAARPAHPARRRTPVLAIALTAVLVGLAACGGNGPTPAPSASASAAPATPAATDAPASEQPTSAASVCDDTVVGGPAATLDPAGVTAATYDNIEQQVEALRGISPTAPVARGVFDKPGLCAYLRTSFREDNPETLVASTERLFKELLLIPEDASLEQLYLELLTSQVAGLYDDTSKHMYVVSSTGELGPADEITYAHEFTHALQDQKFVLKGIVGDATDQGDRTMARSALVEGDATLLMTLWAQGHLTPDQLGQVAGAADPAAAAILERMPAILKDPLLFPYTSGLTVALGAFQASGGFAGVDALYANPPDSTEQVLHADKLAAREAPVGVAFPDDLAARLGDGWAVEQQDTMGELMLEIVLREGGATATRDAAAGWGGDRIALITGPSGETAVVLDTAWDTEADAAEYATALAQTVAKLNAAGKSAALLQPEPSRVVLVVGETADTMGRVANVLGLAG